MKTVRWRQDQRRLFTSENDSLHSNKSVQIGALNTNIGRSFDLVIGPSMAGRQHEKIRSISGVDKRAISDRRDVGRAVAPFAGDYRAQSPSVLPAPSPVDIAVEAILAKESLV
ncbi:hypothetical protein KIN20_027464 [Parelaphostrongylus tenuis]|uniref:Uncharacterized protein n=1 Tax=Parelaphostrongylus tenuis TaxID=148309 RepID=A0AAD5WE47_PARTN|nr:hypothetical protein KIN20_027464 [Parelaphostrongylus tenuis]